MINQTFVERYRVTEKIGEGSTSVVYKAHDIKDKRDVTLKFPKEAIRTNEISSIMRFSQQMKPLIGLNSPFVVNVYDVFQHQGFPVVVTEYVKGESLSQYLKSQASVDIDAMVRIMVDILKGLEFIHSKGIIHRDIKPSNIILEEKESEYSARITDFGLALLLDIAQLQQEPQIVGTFSYMSPEQTGMLKKPLDFRSDIYSAGILFYQLLTKRLPFNADDIPTLIHRHIAQTPTAPAVLNSQISPVLDNIILKMLAKDPQDRYQTEKGIMLDLEEYLSRRKEERVTVDFEIARKDKITRLTYQSRLIGRKKEIGLLYSLIDDLEGKRGNIVLIAGRAGSGKTRLINELHSYAYIRNAFFVSGKCYKTAYKAPYAVLREALDDYIERIKRLPSNLREEHVQRMKEILGQSGKELVKITPKIEELLGEQPPLIEIEPQKEKIRFLITVSNFLVNIATSKDPLIIFLDDLQWIDESSLELLQEMARKVHDSSLLMLFTYRAEEVDPTQPLTKMMISLQDQQIKYHLINIKDLDEEETNSVVAEILSEDPETLKPLSAKIFSQTGGNPFFITEILRTLINNEVVYFEENHYAYDLSKIESLALPDNVIDILIPRIETLTPQTLQVLSYGSVIGKKFIVDDVFSLLSFLEPQQVLSSIEEAITKQFLTRNVALQEEVLFVHDRVREAFYKKLPEVERVELNKKIALSLEKQYKQNLEPVIFDLAYHFLEAEIDDKTLQYSIKAAHKAKATYANIQAIDLYLVAKDILEKQNRTETSEYIEVLENLGETNRLAGRLDESLNVLRICEQLIPEVDKFHKAQVLSKMGDTLWDKGGAEEGSQVLEQALRMLKVRFPVSKTGVILGILKEFTQQMLHVWFPKAFVKGNYQGSPRDLIIVRTLIKLGQTYYCFDMNKTFYYYLKSLNLSEKMGPCSELAYNYICGGPAWITFPWFSRVFRDLDKGLKMAQDLGDKRREGCGYAYFTWCCYLANKPKLGLECAPKAISLLKVIGEYLDLGVAYTFRIHNDWIAGKLNEAVQEREEFLRVVKEARALDCLGWALHDRGMLYALSGDDDPEEVIEDMKESIKLMEQARDNPNEMYSTTILAFSYWRKGDRQSALCTIEEALKLFPTHYNKGPWTLVIFPIAAQIYLDIVNNDPDLSLEKKKVYLKKTSCMCQRSLRCGRIYNYVLGWGYQVNGTYQWAMGKKKKALKMWDKGIEFLRKHTEDKYRLGAILLEEGKFLIHEDDPKLKEKAKRCLEEARGLFSECGAKVDFGTAGNLLGIKEESEELSTAFYEETTTTKTLAERERALSLAEATKLISSILDLDKLLDKIVELSITASGAERGFLLLYNQNTKKLELALSHPQKEQIKEIDFFKLKISKEVVSFVEQQKQGAIYPPVESQKEAIERSESISIYGIRSILCSPLVTKDKLVGMLYLDNHLAEGVFEQKDLDAINSICSQAAVSIEVARLHIESQEKVRLEQEMNTARQIQQSLLPRISPQAGDLKAEGLMLSAKEVAGDFYDFIQYGPDKVGIVVADVSGKGLDSGMVMSMTKSSIVTLSREKLAPRNLVVELNKILCSQLQQQKFISLIYAEYTSGDNTFTWGGGGHEHVIVYRVPQGGGNPEVELIKTGGIVLGMFDDVDDKIPQKSVVLNKGDRIILYTDGVTEARGKNDDMFTLDRLTRVIKEAPGLSVKDFLSYLKEKIQQYIQDASQYDDITLVVLGRD